MIGEEIKRVESRNRWSLELFKREKEVKHTLSVLESCSPNIQQLHENQS